MYCATVAYPHEDGGTFDLAYFETRHVPMFARHLGANCAGNLRRHTSLHEHTASTPVERGDFSASHTVVDTP